MTLDDDLAESVNKVVEELKMTRSAFTRKALREAVSRLNMKRLEERHRKGCRVHPANEEGLSVWENEQNWGDE
jgi:metal-responsive CopG/Arc/MetJ family transcriptional regulator